MGRTEVRAWLAVLLAVVVATTAAASAARASPEPHRPLAAAPGPSATGQTVTADRPEAPLTISDPAINEAIALMDGFAARTGLTAGGHPQRYLWTDAFAVCNWLGLARITGDERYRALALRLVDQVHHTLGRHRTDDPRKGWISGLDEQEGEAHPTHGGLRIGKVLSERGLHEPFDHQLEWERDGQYFHYLSKWMHALDQLARARHEVRFNTWARELAQAALDAFSYQPATSPAPLMYWKMSIDLSRPLVTSMGQHDALDGYITTMQLRATAEGMGDAGGVPDLSGPARRFGTMLEHTEPATADPLGIGGLLADAYRVAQLLHHKAIPDDGLLERLLDAALHGLTLYVRRGELEAPAAYRLPFRELGLAIGMEAQQRLARDADAGRLRISPMARASLAALQRYTPLGDEIEAFWRQAEHRRTTTWAGVRRAMT